MTETPPRRARRAAAGHADRVDADPIGTDQVSADPFSADPAGDDPFAPLGLPARPGLSDDDVRAAWRRVAAATHPDREDGGDSAVFGAAAAAYAALRTEFGRGEALADLGLGPGDTADRHRRRAHRVWWPTGSTATAGRHRARPERSKAGLRAPTPDEADVMAFAPVHEEREAQTIARAAPPWPGLVEAPPHPGSHGHPGSHSHHGQRGRVPAIGWPATWPPVRLPIRLPGGLAWRLACASVVSVIVAVISGWSPGLVGVLAGLLTWLVSSTARARSRRRSG